MGIEEKFFAWNSQSLTFKQYLYFLISTLKRENYSLIFYTILIYFKLFQLFQGSFSSDELGNSVDEKGNTPLHLAAEYGHLECVKMFLSFYPPHMVSLPNDDLSTACALAIKVSFSQHLLKYLHVYEQAQNTVYFSH